MTKSLPDFEPFDWRSLSESPIIGVDEAGRGCLAGPVFAGAVILQSEVGVTEFTDSKLLSETRREELFDVILAHHKVGIGSATVAEIEELNILNAALLAMRRAVEDLGVTSGHVLVDGIFKIKNLEGFQQTPLIKGDLRATPVAAASIVAKVSRDRVMRTMSKEWPQYGFEKHKGYSTEAHKKAIELHGPSLQHRRTFAGVKEFVSS
jgi:ribonuclease HII